MSLKSRVLCPTQDERDQSAVLPVTSIRPVGWACLTRTPVEVPRYVVCSWCSAKPNSSRPAARASRNTSPSVEASSPKTPIDVSAGSSSQPCAPAGSWSGVIERPRVLGGPAGAGGLLGRAHQRLDLVQADVAARHDAGGRALVAADRRDHGQPPAAHHAVGGEGVRRPAQVRLAGLLGEHDAAVAGGQLQGALDDVLRLHAGDCRGAHRPASAWVLRIRTSRNSVARAAVADRRDLAGLALAAVERAAQVVGLRAADRLQRAPEVGRRRLVGHVAQLAGQPAVLDPEEPLPGELEVVALHVDRPALVADDVDAAVDPGDELLGRGPAGGRLQRHVGHPLHRHVAGGVGERAAVGPAEVLQPRHRPVELVADEQRRP